LKRVSRIWLQETRADTGMGAAHLITKHAYQRRHVLRARDDEDSEQITERVHGSVLRLSAVQHSLHHAQLSANERQGHPGASGPRYSFGGVEALQAIQLSQEIIPSVWPTIGNPSQAFVRPKDMLQARQEDSKSLN
jgi:hypothetical protein